MEMQRPDATDEGRRPKWFNSPVSLHHGSLADIHQHVPDFERRNFGLTQLDNQSTRLNNRLDTIVRVPFGEDKTFVPVGVVSKDYVLVPHTAVLDIATASLSAVKISPEDV